MNTNPEAKPMMLAKKQRLFEIAEGEEWTEFLEEVNDYLIEEKMIRREVDSIKSSDICRRIVQFAFDRSEFKRMGEIIILLAKRRGQPKKTVIDIVQLGMEKLDLLSREEKYKLLRTLITATEGKLFLEVEYARVTRNLSEMMVEDGKQKEATKLIQEVQVETFITIDIKEKVEYIVYQMKMVLEVKDYVRLHIISKKISSKVLNSVGFELLKFEYYTLLNQYYLHEELYLALAKNFQTIFDMYHDKTEDAKDSERKEDDPVPAELPADIKASVF